MPKVSIVEYFSEHNGYRCGYCGSQDTNYSHGMWAHRLTAQDYQDLINRGWRRSGQYCYKPVMNKTCCPLYTIRCDALNFQPTRSQKKVLKRMHKFLAFGRRRNEDNYGDQLETNASENEGFSEYPDAAHLKHVAKQAEKDLKNKDLEGQATGSEGDHWLKQEIPCEKDKSEQTSSALKDSLINKSTTSYKGSGADPDRPVCKKAKLMRRERKLKKLLEKAKTDGKSQNVEETFRNNQKKPIVKSIEDFLNEPLPENAAHRLQIRLVYSNFRHRAFENTFSASYSIYKKYQMTIHKDSPEKCSESQYTKFLVNSPITVKLVKPAELINNVGTIYKLYKSYQMTIHKEMESECDNDTFMEFLIDSPILYEDRDKESSEFSGFGSYHQQYWLDDKLIAVGVIDILPYCVSSVYLYYDPAYSFLSLGTYAALREIAFTRELHHIVPDLKYYYMGFYIHSCPKMRYKGQFYPSYLLCPETYTWHAIERCQPKLEVSRYSKFEEDDSIEDENAVVDLNVLQILYCRQQMPYPVYLMMKQDNSNEREVREYAKLTGKKCYSRLLLYRS